MKVMFHKKWKKCTQSRKSQYPQPNTYFDWLPKSFRLCFQHDFQRSNSFSEFLFCSNLMTSNWIYKTRKKHIILHMTYPLLLIQPRPDTLLFTNNYSFDYLYIFAHLFCILIQFFFLEKPYKC